MTIGSMMDTMFTQGESDHAMQALALATVANGWSHHGMCSSTAANFYKALRKDFRTPSEYRLRKAVTALHTQTKEKVENMLRSCRYSSHSFSIFNIFVCRFVQLAVDLWEDNHHTWQPFHAFR